ncbi:unnamed protein product [Choristocarpus tenellus]
MHCADLSGQVMEISIALEWGRRIIEEFHNQAEMEAAAGLPVTCAVSKDPESAMKGQLFFLSKIVMPLWEPFVSVFPELDPLLANLQNNCQYYQRELAKCGKQGSSRSREPTASHLSTVADAPAAVGDSASSLPAARTPCGPHRPGREGLRGRGSGSRAGGWLVPGGKGRQTSVGGTAGASTGSTVSPVTTKCL